MRHGYHSQLILAMLFCLLLNIHSISAKKYSEDEIDISWEVFNQPVEININEWIFTNESIIGYFIEWGDGDESGWINNSHVNHTFHFRGVYILNITAKLDNGELINKELVVSIFYHGEQHHNETINIEELIISILFVILFLSIPIAMIVYSYRKEKKRELDRS
jgi:hypothetical protein